MTKDQFEAKVQDALDLLTNDEELDEHILTADEWREVFDELLDMELR